ncbi:MAG TPA: PilZ domain-containing protein [Polyangiaceae bacterium]|nr:PilZ domain-containing protein [Polyangiaceae bacterium]
MTSSAQRSWSNLRGSGTPSSGTYANKAVRQIGLRAHTNFAVIMHNDNLAAHCRAVDVSSTGIVIDRGHTLSPEDEDGIFRLELYMPETSSPVRALARVVRTSGTEQALRFVAISDADRLTITEHLDRVWSSGAALH